MILERIKIIAEEKGVSIAQIERELGMSSSSISKWKSSNPTATNLYAVAKYLGVSMEDLLGEDTKEVC